MKRKVILQYPTTDSTITSSSFWLFAWIVGKQYLQMCQRHSLSLPDIASCGENTIVTPERKLKCYAVLWLLIIMHSGSRQCAEAPLCFPPALCSRATRMWCCVAVCDLLSEMSCRRCCTMLTLSIKKRRDASAVCDTSYTAGRDAFLCNTTIACRLCLFIFFFRTTIFSIWVCPWRINEQSNL